MHVSQQLCHHCGMRAQRTAAFKAVALARSSWASAHLCLQPQMTKLFAQCSLADFVHELQLAARDASGSALSTDVVARITPFLLLLDDTRTQAVLQQHPGIGSSSELVCSAAAGSKQAWCSMLRDLLLGAGVSVSDAAQLRVYLVVKQCAKLGRVRLPQAGLPVAVATFSTPTFASTTISSPHVAMRQCQPYNTREQCQIDCVLCRKYAHITNGSEGSSCYCYLCHKRWDIKKCSLAAPAAAAASAVLPASGLKPIAPLLACVVSEGNIDVCRGVVNSVCARMRGGSLESLRLLDFQQNGQWTAQVEIACGRWCLQMFAALEQLHDARVFMRVCNAQGAALVRIQLAPAAQRLRLRTLVPVYEMAMGHKQRLRRMGCGGRGKLALLMLQGGGGGGPVPRDCSALMDRIVRRVAAVQVAATLEGLHSKAQALSAGGQYAAAAVLLQQTVGLGHLPSRADLADMLIWGRGVSLDRDGAFELVEEGARLGCLHCQGMMAACCAGGVGCSADAARSLPLARESAGKGSKYGQRMLGLLYRDGLGGVTRDHTAALAQFRLAAAQDYDVAQYSVGHMYQMGHGVAQDQAEALRWYKLAAAQGLGLALHGVGWCYEMGSSVAADRAEAIRWYERAAAAGDPTAADALRRLGL